MTDETVSKQNTKFLLSVSASHGFFLAAAILLGYWLNISLWNMINFGMIDLAIGLGLAGFLISTMYGVTIFAPRFSQEITDTLVKVYRAAGIQVTWPNIIIISLAAGIAEEALFRGAVQMGLLNIMPAFLAIILANFLFTIIHPGNGKAMLMVGVLGLAFGIAFHITGSLLGVMIGHTLYDVWALKRLKKAMAKAV